MLSNAARNVLTHTEQIVGRDGVERQLCLDKIKDLPREGGVKQDLSAHILQV